MPGEIAENVLRRERIVVRFRSYYGPMHKAFDSLDPEKHEAIWSWWSPGADRRELWIRGDRSP
jgi:hypothetical protein